MAYLSAICDTLEEKKIIFGMVDKPDLLGAILNRTEIDPAVVDFVNLKNRKDRGNTALHLAVEQMSHASTSILLKAGNFEVLANDATFTPALENLFQKEKASEIDSNLVQGLLKKTKKKLLSPERTLDCLKIVLADGAPVLSLVDSSQWEEAAAIEGIGDKIATLAPTMGVEIAEWLLVKAEKGELNHRKVFGGLTQVSEKGEIAFAFFSDCSWWDRVEALLHIWPKEGEMGPLIPFMGLDYAEWRLAKNEMRWSNFHKIIIEWELYKGLTVTNKEGKTALSQLGIKRWTDVSMDMGSGLIFRVDNKELEEALIVWGKAQLLSQEEKLNCPTV